MVPKVPLRIFCDSLTIRGVLRVADEVTIFARVIVFEHNDRGETGIDVSGASGTDWSSQAVGTPDQARRGDDAVYRRCWFAPDDEQHDVDAERGDDGHQGRPGTAGGKGQNGGRILIAAERFEGPVPVLRARGGNGGNGGNGGRGQKGGDGGKGATPQECGFLNVGLTDGSRGGDAGAGGPGGTGGAAGAGGDGGQIRVFWVGPSRKPPTKTFCDARGGSDGQPGSGGDGGPPGEPGKGGQMIVRQVAKPLFEDNFFKRNPVMWGDGHNAGPGMHGTNGAPARLPSAPGPSDGMVEVQQVAALSHLLPWMPLRLFEMLLHQVDEDYFVAGLPSPASDAIFGLLAARYQWLSDVAGRLFERPPSVPGSQSRFFHEAWETFLGQGDRLNLWRSVAESAAASRASLRLGRDVFGDGADHVPRLSLTVHEVDFTAELAVAKELLKARDDLRLALGEAHQTMASMRQWLRDLELQIATTQRQLQAIKAQQPPLLSRLAQLDVSLVQRRQDTRTALDALTKGIEEKIHINFAQLLQMIETLAFFPEGEFTQLAMIGSQAGKGLSAVTMGPQEGSSESYALRALVPLAASIATFEAAWDVVQGQIVSDGATVVLAQSKQLDQILQPIWELPDAQEVRRHMRHFVEAAQARNRVILEFNGLVATSARLAGEETLLKTRLDLLKVQAGDAVLVARGDRRAEWLDQQFARSNRRIGRALFALARDYRAATLAPDIFERAVGDRDLLSGSLAGLAARQRLLHDELNQERSERGADTRYPENIDSRGKWVVLHKGNAPAVIEELRAHGRTFVRIPLARKATKASESPLAGMADARLLRFRPYVRGIRGAIGEVVVDYRTVGAEQRVNPVDQLLEFTYAPVHGDFRFKPDALAHFRPIDPGAQWWQPTSDLPGWKATHLAESNLEEKSFQLIGPFTTWQIEIDKVTTPGKVETSGIDMLAIELHLLYRRFLG